MASKNAPDLIVSGAGWLMQFGCKVSSGLQAAGYTSEDIHRLATQQGESELNRGIAAFVGAIAGFSVPSFDLGTGIYRFEVNYDESIFAKVSEPREPKSLAWVTDYATDKRFVDDRKGKRIVTGRIKHFGEAMSQDKIERWTTENGKVLARPKELIDFSRAFPRPALDEQMPLAAPGQFWASPVGDRSYLYLSCDGDRRGLNYVWLSPDGQLDGRWYFLLLDK